MKVTLLSKVILMILCAFILASTIGLYAASEEDEHRCNVYCDHNWGYEAKLYKICYDACIYGANL